MPTLNWIGKDAVINHHKEVPFRPLNIRADLFFGDPESGNLLVQIRELLEKRSTGQRPFIIPTGKKYNMILAKVK
jgi:hypothetical protein